MLTLSLTDQSTIRNQILTRLSAEKYPRLFSSLKQVHLDPQQVLYHAEDDIRFVYFINHGMASLLSITAEGDTIEVANVGNEGLLGIPVLLRQVKMPHEVVVQVPGDAFSINADVLKQEFERDGELKDQLLSYTHALATYMSQLSVCNHFHTLDKRLCRWLLITSHQVQSQSFYLTHEALSQVLGTARTGITMAATKLQRAGLIRYHRGRITILDRVRLEVSSCDCYQMTKTVFETLGKL
jgi:CRP-like cAMP-binding protein